MVFALIHPNYLMKDYTVETQKTWNLVRVEYKANELLLAFSMFRSYLIFQTMLVMTKFYSGKADRIR